MSESVLTISNDGPRITATNYWETKIESDGGIYCSINAGAVRLLIPRSLESHLPEMATAKMVILSRPRNLSQYAMEILFDDPTESPFFIDLSEVRS